MEQYKKGDRVAWTFRCLPGSPMLRVGTVLHVGEVQKYVAVKLDVPVETCGIVHPVECFAIGPYLKKVQ